MGQDGIYLKVLKDDVHESHRSRRSAEKVLNLLNQGKHWVLVTLLLANVIVNESLPVVLDRCLGGGIAAIVGSTILIGMVPSLARRDPVASFVSNVSVQSSSAKSSPSPSASDTASTSAASWPGPS